MSRQLPADTLPPTARAIALLLASTPSVHDAQPGVLHQLLEFSHRYATQVLQDAQVYADHAGRQGKIEMEDVVLAVQARVGWEFGGRVPKEHMLSLAVQTNSIPLPPVPEVFGVRLPPGEDLVAVYFDLFPHKPPPPVRRYEMEEIEESEDGDEDMEPALIPLHNSTPTVLQGVTAPSSVLMPVTARDDSEDDEDDDDLFDGVYDGVDNEEEDDPMDDAQMVTAPPNGPKRKLEEDDEYD